MIRAGSSTGSVLLHGGILLALAGASYLRVEALAGPVIPQSFVVEGPGPPALKGGGASPLRAELKRAPDSQPRRPDRPVQPREAAAESPEAAPGREPSVEGSGSGGSGVGGSSGGAEDGVAWGVPNGFSLGGFGGAGHGLPGNPLAGLPAPESPLHLTAGLRPPERKRYIRPDYPEIARQSRTEGKVILEIVVGRSGEVEEVRLLRSNPLFDRAAMEAVRRWKYEPALLAGMPVRVYLTVVIEFTLR